MSITTIYRRIYKSIPQDELIGSLTRERVALAVRYAGSQASEGIGEARRWLAYALGTDISESMFVQLAMAFEQRERAEEGDLEFWFELENTDANRKHLQNSAEVAIEHTVYILSNRLCSQLGLS